MRFRHKRSVCIAALAVAGLSLPAAAAKPSVSWNNPHHAYVIFNDPNNRSYWSVKEISVDAKPSPTLVLGGSLTNFCQPTALAISPQGYLYVAGFFGPKCQPAIEFFAPGAHGNVAPVGKIAGKKARLNVPYGLAFDRAGTLYEADDQSGPSFTGEINMYAPGANGNVRPIARIFGPNTLLSGVAYVAVDDDGEIFAGQTGGNRILKFPAGANGDIAPIAMNTVQSGNGFGELQASGSTVYAAVGILRQQTPTIYELNATDLSQTGGITDPSFTILFADADSAGKIYVQNFIRGGAKGHGRLLEYEPGSQQPYRVRDDGTSAGGGYIVVGP